MQKLSDDDILKLLVDTQVEFIRYNNIQPELFSFFDANTIDKYLQLLDKKIKDKLLHDKFVFEISYDKQLDCIIFQINIYDKSHIYNIDMFDIVDYIKTYH